MLEMFVIRVSRTVPDRDYVSLLSEWKIEPGTKRHDPNEMTDFNILTFDGRACPGTARLLAKLGDRVRIRFGNLSSMDHHPIHTHGHARKIIETDGDTRTVIANNPGDWAMHCHMIHQVMGPRPVEHRGH